MSTLPPEYVDIPTLYDETHRGKWAFAPEIASMGNAANLTGYLEHSGPATDGSFAICLAGGTGNFVSQALYESIPEAHRPPLNTSDAAMTVTLSVAGQPQTPVGSIIMPIILINAETNTRFRIKLYALVLPRLLMGMFIGEATAVEYLRTTKYSRGGSVLWSFEFRTGEITKVEYRG